MTESYVVKKNGSWFNLFRYSIIFVFLLQLLIFPALGADSQVQLFTQWGSTGNGDGQFRYPSSIAVDDSGYVYVTDSSNCRIQKFDSNGNYLMQWGSRGTEDGKFWQPSAIAVDNKGNVFISDAGRHNLQVFSSDGKFLKGWKISGTNFITADNSGNFYCSYWYSGIEKYSSDGTKISEWGSEGEGAGQFDNAVGIAIDDSNNVYVVDTGNNRIQKFSADGVYVTQWGSHGTGEGQFDNPQGIAVDGKGNVYVADKYNQRIEMFDSKGQFLTQWPTIQKGRGDYFQPHFVAADKIGNVYVIGSDGDFIQKYSTADIQSADSSSQDVSTPPGNQIPKRESELKKPVLFLHGLGDTPDNVKSHPLYAALKRDHDVYVIEYSSGPGNAYGDMRDYAKILDERINEIKEETNSEKVDIVAHSMGGLISRYRIQNIDGNDVGKLIMIGTPNHGSELSDEDRYCLNPFNWIYCAEHLFSDPYRPDDPYQPINAMKPGSDFLSELNGNRQTEKDVALGVATEKISNTVNYTVIAGNYYPTLGSGIIPVMGDGIVAYNSARLSNVAIFPVHGNHMEQYDKEEIIDKVLELLDQPDIIANDISASSSKSDGITSVNENAHVISSITIDATPSTDIPDPEHDFQLVEAHIEDQSTKYGIDCKYGRCIIGEVKNVGDHKYQYLIITFDLYNSEGKKIGFAKGKMDLLTEHNSRLGPGESTDFYAEVINGGVTSFKAVKWDGAYEYPPATPIPS